MTSKVRPLNDGGVGSNYAGYETPAVTGTGSSSLRMRYEGNAVGMALDGVTMDWRDNSIN